MTSTVAPNVISKLTRTQNKTSASCPPSWESVTITFNGGTTIPTSSIADNSITADAAGMKTISRPNVTASTGARRPSAHRLRRESSDQVMLSTTPEIVGEKRYHLDIIEHPRILLPARRARPVFRESGQMVLRQPRRRLQAIPIRRLSE